MREQAFASSATPPKSAPKSCCEKSSVAACSVDRLNGLKKSRTLQVWLREFGAKHEADVAAPRIGPTRRHPGDRTSNRRAGETAVVHRARGARRREDAGTPRKARKSKNCAHCFDLTLSLIGLAIMRPLGRDAVLDQIGLPRCRRTASFWSQCRKSLTSSRRGRAAA